MQLRRKYKNGTLLAAFAMIGEELFGMICFNQSYAEISVSWRNGNPVYTVLDDFGDKKMAALIEQRLANYIIRRMQQEKELDQSLKKFSPNYLDGEVYLRRRRASALSHEANLRRSAISGRIQKKFAERLACLNLVVRFKPRRK
jgi:hypothetical protein